jgi:hypothetical protein
VNWVRFTLLLLAALLGTLLAQPGAPNQTVRFQVVDIFIDSKESPLAAYQLEFSVKTGNARVVGVEGGEHSAFNEAPYYDPKAIQQERVIIAAFNTGAADQLPKGKTRVATIHFQITGDQIPEFKMKLEIAATSDGKRTPVEATFQERKPAA